MHKEDACSTFISSLRKYLKPPHSELVQLKLNIESSVGESTPTEVEIGTPTYRSGSLGIEKSNMMCFKMCRTESRRRERIGTERNEPAEFLEDHGCRCYSCWLSFSGNNHSKSY